MLTAGPACCSLLSALLGSTISYPGSSAYDNSTSSYFAGQQQGIHPACIVSARTTADVSAAVRVLASQDCAFAVRSGGHATNANYSASPSGVTIDLSGLASVKPSTDRTTVSVGPGARWGDVYTALRPYDLTVAGGRASSVGVGGLTAGGGVSFFSPRVGFTADTLVGAEVVLASGAVVQARDDGDGSSYADLLRALRGGGNNFGLVTRFDFAAIEAGDFWGGLVLYPDTVAPLQLAALADFSSQPDYDEYATAIVSFSLVDGSVTLVSDTLVYTQNITTTPPVFHPFLDLPGPISSSLRSDSHRGFADEGDLGRSPGQRELWAVTTISTTLAALNTTYHAFQRAHPLLATVSGVLAVLSFEPLPRALYARARSGSNAFGDLAAQQGPLMIVLMSVSWTDGADDAVVDRAVRRMMAEVEADPDADTHPWRYMNYAASWQKAIASYGAASVARLQAVSRTYDPSGVFQKLVAGGQKLPV